LKRKEKEKDKEKEKEKEEITLYNSVYIMLLSSKSGKKKMGRLRS